MFGSFLQFSFSIDLRVFDKIVLRPNLYLPNLAQKIYFLLDSLSILGVLVLVFDFKPFSYLDWLSILRDIVECNKYNIAPTRASS